MTQQTTALVIFGTLLAGVAVMYLLERRAVARRKAARGGREVDLSAVFDPTRENGKPTGT